MSNYVKQVKNPIHKGEYTDIKTIDVEPFEESKSTSLSMPTDPALLQDIQRQREVLARANGINPDTGEVTPFQALGYNPDDERKRREAEMAINDRKRKENAWYNAFAVVGDALTAGLGGNVWQRQPNRIGAQANADNQRLIAEQKAEDMNNAAMMRNAGVKYADAVNRLIQNYLTKTTTTNRTGGKRTEKTTHGAQDSYEYRSHVVGTSGGGRGGYSGRYGSRSGGKGEDDTKPLQLIRPDGTPVTYYIPKNEWQNVITGMYNRLRRNGFIDEIERFGNNNPKFQDKEDAVISLIEDLEASNDNHWKQLKGGIIVPISRTKGVQWVDGWIRDGWGTVNEEENYDF